ncbi:MAG: SAM-dependent methyltransferase [Chthoniobacterales bacterium]
MLAGPFPVTANSASSASLMDRETLVTKIAELFSAGPVSFECFMDAALYDPEIGYYAAGIRTVGSRGDFSTSATLHPVLGKAIAAWLQSFHTSVFAPLHIIEVGAGTGALAKSVLDSLGLLGRARLNYHIVEVSRPLKAQQQELLKRNRITWHEDMRSALKACDGAAHIFSNELVDAFPCRVFIKSSDRWQELALELRDGSVTETFLPLSPEEKFPESNFPDGQRIEVQSRYREWLAGWLPDWKSGNMLTIDYGDSFPQLYRRRPRGTLRAYFRHERLEGSAVYQRFAKQDITADVNFSLLQEWGEALKLQTVQLERQSHFIQRMLSKKALKVNDAAQDYLLRQSGPGDAFQVLHQRR